MPVDFPRSHLAAMNELATRLIDKREPGSDLKKLARDLLRGFHDVCSFAGLDRVLGDLAQANPGLDVSARTTLEDHESLFAALVAQLTAINPDGGGPRNAKAAQLTDSVVAAVGLTPVDEPDRSIALDDTLRGEVAKAITSVAEAELAVPAIRESIISEARKRLDANFHSSLTKMATHLDERGTKLLKQPKVPIDAQHAVERALFEARNAIVARVARAAFERAKPILARGNADSRLDQPITLRATPLEVAILRASDGRIPMTPAAMVHSLLESLTQLAGISWRAPERTVHQYRASATFAVGDLIEHPKFGRGAVVATLANRIDVEFPEGKYTLVHVPPRR